MQLQKIYYTPQLAFFTVLAQITVLIFGRATSKTEGCTSLWLLNNLLPYCSLIVANYENLQLVDANNNNNKPEAEKQKI